MAGDPRNIACSFMGFEGSFVTITVGPEQQRLTVHISRLNKQASRTFRTELEQNSVPGNPSKFCLPDMDTSLFKDYIHYLYSSKIPILRSAEAKQKRMVDVGEYQHLTALYCFGEQYQDAHFKNTVIDAIIASTKEEDADGERWFPTNESVDIVYQGTPAGSPARKLMVDLHIEDGRASWLDLGANNHEFVTDLAKGFYERKNRIAILQEAEAERYAHNPNARYYEPERLV